MQRQTTVTYILYQNGDSYKGDFKDGYFNGYGTYKYASGKVENGIFENGAFYDPLKKNEKHIISVFKDELDYKIARAVKKG